jgi:hypothetical protein
MQPDMLPEFRKLQFTLGVFVSRKLKKLRLLLSASCRKYLQGMALQS